MKELCSAELSILSLMFGYQSHEIAIRAMDILGDEQSANLLISIRLEWEAKGAVPDLSHQNGFGQVQLRPSRTEFITVASGLIDAFDRAREAGDSTGKLRLRRTMDALFELRAHARLAIEHNEDSEPSTLRDTLLSRELSSFPLSSTLVKRLRAEGYLRLRDLAGQPTSVVAGKIGLTSKQVNVFLEVIRKYILVSISREQIQFRTMVIDMIAEKRPESLEVIDEKVATWLYRYWQLSDHLGPQQPMTQWESDLDALDGGSKVARRLLLAFIRRISRMEKLYEEDARSLPEYFPSSVDRVWLSVLKAKPNSSLAKIFKKYGL